MAKPRDNEEGVLRLQSRAWSFACLARFARWTKKKESLLVVLFSPDPTDCPWVHVPSVFGADLSPNCEKRT